MLDHYANECNIAYMKFTVNENNRRRSMSFLLALTTSFLLFLLLTGCEILVIGHPFNSDPSVNLFGGDSPNQQPQPLPIYMVDIPAGRFQRDGQEENISNVSAFRISRHEITRHQFAQVMGTDPSEEDASTGTPDDPAQMVNWYHAIAFCNKLSLQEGLEVVYTVDGIDDWQNLQFSQIPTDDEDAWNTVAANWDANGYRLPTEMEWLWAATGAYQDLLNSFSGEINTGVHQKNFAGYNGTNTYEEYAWGSNNANSSTHPAGTKIPNELGLFDMTGNVSEWCWDWYAAYPDGEQNDYRGPSATTTRVIRGSNFGNGDQGFFFVNRQEAADSIPHVQSHFRGMRIAQNP